MVVESNCILLFDIFRGRVREETFQRSDQIKMSIVHGGFSNTLLTEDLNNLNDLITDKLKHE